MHVTISLISPPAQIRGWLRNAFLEPQPNLFVGVLSGRQVAELVEKLEESQCDGLVIAHTKKSPLGVRIKSVGSDRRRAVVELDGVQVVKKVKNQTVTG